MSGALRNPKVGEVVLAVVPNGKIRPLLVTHVFRDLQRAVGGMIFCYPPEDNNALAGVNRMEYSDLNEPNTWHFQESGGTLTLVQ